MLRTDRVACVALFALALVVALPGVGIADELPRSPEVSINVGGGSGGLRRRPVKRPASPTQDRCVTFAAVRPGLMADYVATSAQGTITFQVTYISDSDTKSMTTQEVQSSAGNASVETTIDYETISSSSGPQRAVKKIAIVATSTPLPGFDFVIETETTHVPSLVLGPAAEWCENDVWITPATTQTTTVVTNGAAPVTTITTTIAGGGEVLSIGEMVTTPAGTFETLKYIGTITGVNGLERARIWLSLDQLITVRQETLDASNQVTSTVELVDLQ